MNSTTVQPTSARTLAGSMNEESGGLFRFFLLPLMTTLLFLQAFRVYIGQVYFQNLSEMSLGPSILLVFLLLSPAAILLVRNIQNETLLILTATGVAAFRFIMPFVQTALAAYLLVAGMTVAFYGMYLTVAVSMRSKDKQESLPSDTLLLSIGISLGIAADLTFRNIGVTWDPTTGPLGILVAPVLCIVTFILIYASCSASKETPSASAQMTRTASRMKITFAGLGFGGVMFAVLTFLAYPNVLSRWTNSYYEVASISVFGGLIGYVLIATSTTGRNLLMQKKIIIPLNLVTLVVAIDLAYLLSPFTAVLAGVTIFAFMLNLRILWMFLSSHNAHLSDYVIFHFAGMLLLLFLLLFSVLTVAAGQILTTLEGLTPYLILIGFVLAVAPALVISAGSMEVFE